MKIPTRGLVPPNGWHFPATPDYLIQGSSYSDVVSRLSSYRQQNRLPAGDPAREVAHYLCTNWPHFCSEANDIPPNLLCETCCT